MLTFVSAGAGSGKTHHLTEILRERLSGGEVEPGGVIATTFTRKAAMELRERARAHLLASGHLGLANAMGEALVGTVNGISQALLQRFCFDAGLSPDLRVLEEADAAVLLQQCIEEVLDDQALSRLLALSSRLGIEEWSEDLSGLLTHARANDIRAVDFPGFAARNVSDLLSLFDPPSQRDLDADLRIRIDLILPELRAAAANSTVKKTTQYLEKLEEFRRKLDDASYAWSDWPKLCGETPEAKLVSLIGAVRDEASRYLTHPGLHSDLREYVTLTFSVAAAVLARYAERKREQGLLDFTDQEVLLLKAMEAPAISAILDDELDLLLVDEFQDTSPVQLALFMRLTALAKETYWVGDIKQAIYGFRGSDARLMDAVIDALPQLGGTTEILDRSWRSRPSLVTLVNEIFVRAFAPMPASRVALGAERVEKSDETAFELWELSGRNIDLRINALAFQTKALLDSGRTIVDKATGNLRPLRPGDIAILCRSKDRVATVLRHLLAAAVPFATGHTGLLLRPETILALACLRRLNDPEDTIATAEIVSLGDCEEPECWLADRLAHLASGGLPHEWREVGDAPHPVLGKIAAFRAEVGMLSPREAMERIISGCDLAPRVLRWCRGDVEARQRLANLDALISLAEAYEDRCRSSSKPGSISGLLLWLDELARDEKDAQPTLGADAVHVLTHHGAKGLEWPVVILLDLESDIRDRYWGIAAESIGDLDVRSPLANRFIRFRPWPFGKSTKVPLRDIAAASPAGVAARQAAVDEERRLLYVSMTRARDLLIFGLQKLVWSDDQWLGVTHAPWLLSSAQLGDSALPGAMGIPSHVRQAIPVEPTLASSTPSEPLHWFQDRHGNPVQQRLYVSPSGAAPIAVRSSESLRISDGVPIAHGFDRDVVGTAIHAVIAAGMGASGPLNADETERVLRRHGVAGSADPFRLVAFVIALRAWLGATWPEGAIHAELAIRIRDDGGRVARGQIDLLIDLPDARVILDHKSGVVQERISAETLAAYAGQLTGYATALQQLDAKHSTLTYVVLPVIGSVMRLTT